jgi:hypothetical protein
MRKRSYYSVRTNKNPNASLDLPIMLRLFKDIYQNYVQKDYFQEAFGYDCVDAGEVPGILGPDIEAQMLRKLFKPNLWPINEKYTNYSEDDLFDVIEFLFDYISKPLEGYHHTYNGCGWHYETFDKNSGQQEFKIEINDLLSNYEGGHELSDQGEILVLADNGFEPLLTAKLPVYDPENVEERVNQAVLKYRRYRSTAEDRRDAIRDLADVLEYLRPQLKQILTLKDESDLYLIANKFGIRHHNESQQTKYDKNIWYSWMFYYYLATIHASLRLIKKSQE